MTLSRAEQVRKKAQLRTIFRFCAKYDEEKDSWCLAPYDHPRFGLQHRPWVADSLLWEITDKVVTRAINLTLHSLKGDYHLAPR